ncbi:unnamed protein product [Darwinula stevensoni]|uniref:Uncharacterized protein n=1 Tax=Darwinula stevensoni TaxID=69355 RepID=A0A7R8X5E9_9CRUS|nr:unnamed protein product [Darwinula stevensoni]CAG0887026.1 unnamed protein product [Darwinula stevensoni]
MRAMPGILLHGIATGIVIALLAVTQSHGLTPYNCNYKGGASGVTADCEPDEMVFYVCGAGGNTGACVGSGGCAAPGDCATRIWCCHVEEGSLESDNCQTHGGSPGQMLSCPEDQFMRGACSSFFGEMCSGGVSHSINCCDYRYRFGGAPLIPWDPAEEGSTNGHSVSCPEGRVATGLCASEDADPDCTGDDFTMLICAEAFTTPLS